MARTVAFATLAMIAAIAAGQDDHGNNMVGVPRPGDGADNEHNVVGIPQAGAEFSGVEYSDNDIFADAEYDHEYDDAVDAAAVAFANGVAPSPTVEAVPDVQDRRPLDEQELARAEHAILLSDANTDDLGDDEEDSDNDDDADEDNDDANKDNDDADEDNDDAGEGNDDVETLAGNVTDVAEAPVLVASVASSSVSDSSSTTSPSPFGIVGIALGCVATVCAAVVLVRSRRQVAQPSSESTLVMDDIRQRESEVGIN